MEQYIYNEQNGIWYELRGDYYIPCLKLPAEKEERSIGVWAVSYTHLDVQKRQEFTPHEDSYWGEYKQSYNAEYARLYNKCKETVSYTPLNGNHIWWCTLPLTQAWRTSFPCFKITEVLWLLLPMSPAPSPECIFRQHS